MEKFEEMPNENDGKSKFHEEKLPEDASVLETGHEMEFGT